MWRKHCKWVFIWTLCHVDPHDVSLSPISASPSVFWGLSAASCFRLLRPQYKVKWKWCHSYLTFTFIKMSNCSSNSATSLCVTGAETHNTTAPIVICVWKINQLNIQSHGDLYVQYVHVLLCRCFHLWWNNIVLRPPHQRPRLRGVSHCDSFQFSYDRALDDLVCLLVTLLAYENPPVVEGNFGNKHFFTLTRLMLFEYKLFKIFSMC